MAIRRALGYIQVASLRSANAKRTQPNPTELLWKYNKGQQKGASALNRLRIAPFFNVCLFLFVPFHKSVFGNGLFLVLRFCRLLPLYCRSTNVKLNQVRSSVVNKMSTVAVKRSLKRQVMSFTFETIAVKIIWENWKNVAQNSSFCPD